MAEDLVGNLSNYRLQLQQVEAALTTDPDNDDLLKLKNDLQEVITLTQELVTSQTQRTLADSEDDDDDDETSSPPVATSSSAAAAEARAWLATDITWKAGDKCRAPWSDNHQYYAATVDEILDDGTCSVIFDKYGTTEVTQVSVLKPWDEAAEAEDAAAKKPKTKKDLSIAQREYKKKKAQKKAQRLKQMEDEREQDKNKWISFNSKVFSKTNKGKVKKSIFATTDMTMGRVGVGTCGVSGRPMTKFTYMEKYKK